MTQLLMAALFLLFANPSISKEVYDSETGKFSITFPDVFEADEHREDNMNVISITCTYKSMILVVSVFVYDEIIPEDEYATTAAEGIVVTADAFGSKFKEKKVEVWEADEGAIGFQNPIKGKLSDGQGGKIKVFGNIYIVVHNNIEYRLTCLSDNKKTFDEGIEGRFINSLTFK